MTTPEHALVGIHAAMATGLLYKYDWTLIALAGVASIVPDWDGLPMLVDMTSYESGHRVWGHNIISILITSFALAWSQTRFHWLEFFGRKIAAHLPSDSELQITNSRCPATVLFLMAATVQFIHLPCDIVVSGGNGLSDWLTKPFWPFSDSGYVLPLIPWGDVGPTVVLMAGVILSAIFPRKTTIVSIAALICMCIYLIVRGKMRGVI